MTNANAPNVENVEMTNAFVNNARNANNFARAEQIRIIAIARAEQIRIDASIRQLEKDIEAAKKAENNAAKKAAENANKAAENAKKAEENARQAAVNRSKAEAAAARAAAKAKREGSTRNNAAAKKANATAKKAAENAEKAKKAAAANTNKAVAANAILKNVDNKFKEIQKKINLSKTEKNKEGTKVYRQASMKLHPQRPGGSEESFKKLAAFYSNFQTKIGTKVTVSFNDK